MDQPRHQPAKLRRSSQGRGRGWAPHPGAAGRTVSEACQQSGEVRQCHMAREERTRCVQKTEKVIWTMRALLA